MTCVVPQGQARRFNFSFELVDLIGITGGVGMGKSTAHSLLVERGVPVVDTDQIARVLVEPGQSALSEIQCQFGSNFINSDGSLRRSALAKVVFSDPNARQRLEAILHPRIRARWMALVDEWRNSRASLGVVVIPLLFETDAASCFNLTVCVACSAAAQAARLGGRGWPTAEIQQRIAAQWPIEKKIDACDLLVWTEGNLGLHAQQWNIILQAVRAR